MDVQSNHQEMQEKESVSEIRQNLVDTAVEFLNMDKILPQPQSVKCQFLEKKGLTKEEIEVAFKQSKNQQMNNVYQGVSPHNYYPQNQLASFPPPVPVPYVPHTTFWLKLRDSTNMIIFLSGIAFGFKYLYKHYIGPYLTGQKPKSKDDAVIEVQKSVMVVLQQIEATLEKINKNILHVNQTKLETEAIKNSESSSSSLEDIKTELSTIKSLLINKKSFPAAPSFYPSIPQWQKRTQILNEILNDEQNGSERDITNKEERSITNTEDSDKQESNIVPENEDAVNDLNLVA